MNTPLDDSSPPTPEQMEWAQLLDAAAAALEETEADAGHACQDSLAAMCGMTRTPDPYGWLRKLQVLQVRLHALAKDYVSQGPPPHTFPRFVAHVRQRAVDLKQVPIWEKYVEPMMPTCWSILALALDLPQLSPEQCRQVLEEFRHRSPDSAESGSDTPPSSAPQLPESSTSPTPQSEPLPPPGLRDPVTISRDLPMHRDSDYLPENFFKLERVDNPLYLGEPGKFREPWPGMNMDPMYWARQASW